MKRVSPVCNSISAVFLAVLFWGLTAGCEGSTIVAEIDNEGTGHKESSTDSNESSEGDDPVTECDTDTEAA
jgi:hypothetical protein